MELSIECTLNKISRDFDQSLYPLSQLLEKQQSFAKGVREPERQAALFAQAAAELTTQEAPGWEFIAARFRMLQFKTELQPVLKALGICRFSDKLRYLAKEGLYGQYILENYTPEELDTSFGFIEESRDELLTYSSLDLLLKRYVIQDHGHQPLETVQEMFLGIALHLAMQETDRRLEWVRGFYDMLSTLKVTMATPTLSNARKPYHQLSSCFIDTVPRTA